jgi:thymidylate synthase (FAD)
VAGSDAERLIEYAARRCYLSFTPGLNPNVVAIRRDSRLYHENILKQAHGSVLEHANVTFAIEFVSRVFTHELVRHRVGIAYSQESLRYVRLTNLKFRIPECIEINPEAKALFLEAVSYLETCQQQLAKLFAIDDTKDFAGKKILTSAFRRIAPIGLATGIVVTCNFRTLRWLIEHRSTQAAEEEIREVMGMLAQIAVKHWPFVFGDFTEEQGTWIPKYHKV